MKRYKRVLVCADRIEQAAPMLAYVGGRSRVAESDEVIFLHVIDDAVRPPGDDDIAPSGDTDAQAMDRLSAQVAEHFQGHGREKTDCLVVRGSPLIETLRVMHDREVDLVMLGRHYGRTSDEDDEALLARRITRKATCSVLVLPDEYAPQADLLLVPVRDSDCSAAALEVACGIAAATGAAVTALNVFQVSAGYSRVGKSLVEHQALLEAGAQRECANLLKRVSTHDVAVTCRCVPDLRSQPVPIILSILGDGRGKAVVIGARGRTGAAG
ncbi:MAG: universal stress protein, partial [Planctomycetes bacterium]|nr:universal stress protein [Planctomycetota bacterium]